MCPAGFTEVLSPFHSMLMLMPAIWCLFVKAAQGTDEGCWGQAGEPASVRHRFRGRMPRGKMPVDANRALSHAGCQKRKRPLQHRISTRADIRGSRPHQNVGFDPFADPLLAIGKSVALGADARGTPAGQLEE